MAIRFKDISHDFQSYFVCLFAENNISKILHIYLYFVTATKKIQYAITYVHIVATDRMSQLNKFVIRIRFSSYISSYVNFLLKL